MATQPKPVVLTIAGSDSSAGAGIQADARVLGVLGTFAATAITAVTAQNTRGVAAWEPVTPKLLAAQIDAVLSDLDVRALKTGLLPGARHIDAVVSALGSAHLPLVVDPVLGSSSGTRFLDDKGRRALLKRLFPRATLVTPNLPEAEALTGLSLRKPADLQQAALRLLDSGCWAVLIKGGHGKGALLVDTLVTANGTVAQWAAVRKATVNTHGTGCVLSAGVAAGLAHGLELVPAIDQARRLLQTSLERNGAWQWGKGRGPAFAGW